MKNKFIFIVYDIGRPTKYFHSRGKAERHRLQVTCGECKPRKSCPHMYESWIVKTSYTNLEDVLKQYISPYKNKV